MPNQRCAPSVSCGLEWSTRILTSSSPTSTTRCRSYRTSVLRLLSRSRQAILPPRSRLPGPLKGRAEMRLSIDHQTGFRYATRVKSSYNEARMTPAASDHQTVWSSRVTIEPAAWSFSYTDYWGTAVTTFEVHEPHERLTVHAQGVVETHGDDLAWDVDRRVAPNDLGWPALLDRAVVDRMAEFLTVNERTEPPEELVALAAATTTQPPRLA